MTTIKISTNNSQFIRLFEHLATEFNVPFEKSTKNLSISKSMEKALEDEKEGRITKLVNPTNAVAEILG